MKIIKWLKQRLERPKANAHAELAFKSNPVPFVRVTWKDNEGNFHTRILMSNDSHTIPPGSIVSLTFHSS